MPWYPDHNISNPCEKFFDGLTGQRDSRVLKRMNDKPNLRQDLPALPFGGAIAKVSSDITMFSERMATVITSLNYYEAIGHPDDFMSKTHSLMLDDLKLVANVNTPIAVDVGSSEDITLMIPFHGECISTVGGHCYAWRAGQSAMFLPAAARGGHSSERATVMIDFDPDHLQRVAATMLNAKENVFVDLRLHEPRLLALQWGSLSFELIFRQICRMIDPLCAQPEVLRQLGVDDLIYRNAVVMLRPELFLANSLQSPVRDKQDKLDRLLKMT